MGDRTRDRRPSRYNDSDDSSEEDDVVTHIACWIPADNIDLTVLAAYLKEFIDNTATIRHSKNPNDPSKSGFTITARNTISVAGCRDIIEDSKSWEHERRGRGFRRDPYSFQESDTWEDRKKKGATPGYINPRATRRRRGGATATADPPRALAAQSQGQGRHARDPSPQRPTKPSNPDPDAFARMTLGEEPAKANQKTRLTMIPSAQRHKDGDDDSKSGSRTQDGLSKKDSNRQGSRQDSRQPY